MVQCMSIKARVTPFSCEGSLTQQSINKTTNNELCFIKLIIANLFSDTFSMIELPRLFELC